MRCQLVATTRRLLRIASVLSISGLLACSGNPGYDQVGQKEAQGTQVGSIVGSVIGGYVPVGNSIAGQVIASQAGTIGGFVGGRIGAALDEQDRRALEQTTRAAFQTGERKSFSSNRTGVQGSVTVTANSKNAVGQPCRTVKQEVVLADKRMLSDSVSACKGPNGWEV
jgi:surface antigen